MKERKRVEFPEYQRRGATLFQKLDQKVEISLEKLLIDLRIIVKIFTIYY